MLVTHLGNNLSGQLPSRVKGRKSQWSLIIWLPASPTHAYKDRLVSMGMDIGRLPARTVEFVFLRPGLHFPWAGTRTLICTTEHWVVVIYGCAIQRSGSPGRPGTSGVHGRTSL